MHYMLVTSITLPLQAASNGRNYMHYMANYMLSKMLMAQSAEIQVQSFRHCFAYKVYQLQCTAKGRQMLYICTLDFKMGF